MSAVNASISPSPEPSHQVMEQAAEWFALLRSGEATAADRDRWQAWLGNFAEHQQAWAYVERISHRFRPLQSSPDRRTAAAAFREANDKMRRRRQTLLGIAALQKKSFRFGIPCSINRVKDHPVVVLSTQQSACAHRSRPTDFALRSCRFVHAAVPSRPERISTAPW
ncbi:MAG: FecR/PupR family sigma factor regulator [Burkholderiaceae bacterium]